MEADDKKEILEAIQSTNRTLEERLGHRFDARIDEVYEAINAFAEATDRRFEGLEERMEKRFVRIESQMLTKDYLDRKLWDLKGDMVDIVNRAIGKHETRLHAT